MNKNRSDSLSKTQESRAIEVMLQLSCGKVKNLEVQPIDLVFVQIKNTHNTSTVTLLMGFVKLLSNPMYLMS